MFVGFKMCCVECVFVWKSYGAVPFLKVVHSDLKTLTDAKVYNIHQQCLSVLAMSTLYAYALVTCLQYVFLQHTVSRLYKENDTTALLKQMKT